MIAGVSAASTRSSSRPSFDAAGWPTLASNASAIAHDAIPLILERRRWIHRQVETLTFIDADRMRRHVSLDLTVPAQPSTTDAVASVAGVVYLPVALLRRRVMDDFDMRDEQGAALPCLTVPQHNAIVQSMLSAVALGALAEAGIPSPKTDAKVKRTLNTLHEMIIEQSRQANMDWTKQANSRSGLARHIMADLIARPLIEDLTTQFVLFVPLAAAAGERRVLKFSLEVPIERLPGQRRSERPHNAKMRPAITREVRIDTPIAGRAGSVHVEVPAPDELVIASARLIELDRGEEHVLADIGRAPVPIAHLHPKQVPERGRPVQLVVSFALRRDGLATAGALIAVTTSTLLATGLSLHLADVSPRADAAGAVIVALPALYAPVLALSSTHRLVRSIVRTMRTLVLASAALSFAAAASLAATLPAHVRPWLWLGLLIASLPSSLGLSRMWLQAPQSSAEQADRRRLWGR